jgi:hypothetical protein
VIEDEIAPIGFVLLTHQSPPQAVRLVTRLNALFDAPPIAWHHDLAQCPLDVGEGWPNVTFVRPHIETSWGGLSVVEATVAALRLLHDRDDPPEWTIFLSGADYPIAPAGRVLEDLRQDEWDAHLEAVPIPPIPTNPFEAERHRRYWKVWVHVPPLRPIGIPRRLAVWTDVPFSPTFRCYAGSTWFSIAPRAARRLIDFHDGDRRLADHLRHSPSSDECYPHTAVANDPTLRISGRDWRYCDWSARLRHPKTLDMSDLEAVSASGAHFARKLDLDTSPELYDALDEISGS